MSVVERCRAKFDQGQNCRAKLLDISIVLVLSGVVECVWPGARLSALQCRVCSCALGNFPAKITATKFSFLSVYDRYQNEGRSSFAFSFRELHLDFANRKEINKI